MSARRVSGDARGWRARAVDGRPRTGGAGDEGQEQTATGQGSAAARRRFGGRLRPRASRRGPEGRIGRAQSCASSAPLPLRFTLARHQDGDFEGPRQE